MYLKMCQIGLRSCRVLSKISNDSALQKNNSLDPIFYAFGLRQKDADFKLLNTFGQYFAKPISVQKQKQLDYLCQSYLMRESSDVESLQEPQHRNLCEKGTFKNYVIWVYRLSSYFESIQYTA